MKCRAYTGSPTLTRPVLPIFPLSAPPQLVMAMHFQSEREASVTISQVLFSDCGKRAPVIACPDDVRKNLPSGQRTMPVEVPYPRVGYNTAALGSCPKPYFNCTSNHKSGSTFYAGNTAVTWACVDNQGLAVSCAFGIRLIYSGEASTQFEWGARSWNLSPSCGTHLYSCPRFLTHNQTRWRSSLDHQPRPHKYTHIIHIPCASTLQQRAALHPLK